MEDMRIIVSRIITVTIITTVSISFLKEEGLKYIINIRRGSASCTWIGSWFHSRGAWELMARPLCFLFCFVLFFVFLQVSYCSFLMNIIILFWETWSPYNSRCKILFHLAQLVLLTCRFPRVHYFCCQSKLRWFTLSQTTTRHVAKCIFSCFMQYIIITGHFHRPQPSITSSWNVLCNCLVYADKMFLTWSDTNYQGEINYMIWCKCR